MLIAFYHPSQSLPTALGQGNTKQMRNDVCLCHTERLVQMGTENMGMGQ